MDYEWDVFLSYLHERPSGPWVNDHLLPYLIPQLGNALNQKARVFYDRTGIHSGQKWPARLKQTLCRSRCLVGIWSPLYFHSEWCLSECAVMLHRESQLGYAYETVTALIGNNLEHAELLLANRDEFVQTARSTGRIPKVPLRESQWECVLLIGVGSGSLRVVSEQSGTKVKEQGEVLQRYHSTVSENSREEGGVLVESDGQSFLFAFPQPEKALRCALSIQESMAVKRPISGPSGVLSARMAVHASDEGNGSTAKMRILRNVASLIASKARDGEILVSDQARKLQTEPVQGVEFEAQIEPVELPSAREPELMKVFKAVRIVTVELTDDELEALRGQDPETRGGGGFQALLVALQERIKGKRRLELTISDRERIARYAHDYRSGGWQGRLRKIFGRTLGTNLGREGASS
jgi:TIR domain